MKLFNRNTKPMSIEARELAATTKTKLALAVFDDIADDLFAASDELDELSVQRTTEAEGLRAQADALNKIADAAVAHSVELYEQSTALSGRANKIAGLSI